MSPYPLQTDRKTIINTARALIEREGIEHLSLAKLAKEVGIKAPSLYNHIDSKNSLLHAVIEETYLQLFTAYDKALESSGSSPEEKLLTILDAHYRFAHANPRSYILAYTAADADQLNNPDMLLQKAIQIQVIIKEIAGEGNSLTALRGLLALVHGFVMLELNGQLRRGGDLQQTLQDAVRAYLRGWH